MSLLLDLISKSKYGDVFYTEFGMPVKFLSSWYDERTHNETIAHIVALTPYNKEKDFYATALFSYNPKG